MITKEDQEMLTKHYRELNPNADDYVARDFLATVEFQIEPQRKKMAEEIAALKEQLEESRSAALCHLDGKLLAQKERDALRANIERARAWLKECQGGHVIALSGINRIDEALKELTQ